MITALRACIVLSLVVLVAACGSSPQKSDREQTAAMHESGNRPVLVPAGLDVFPVISAAGAPWDRAAYVDTHNYDDSLHLNRQTKIFDRGVVSVDRTDDGGLYMIRVQSGAADRCGNPADLGRAYAQLMQPLRMPLLENADVEHIKQAWSTKDGWFEVTKNHILIRALGGCLQSLIIKAV